MIDPRSSLAERFWAEGRLSDCPIIDFHGHMDEWRGLYFPRGGREGMLRSMDEAGVRLLLFCGHLDLFAPCVRNARNIEAVQQAPRRLRAYFAVNPNHADPEKDLALFEAHRDLFAGFKTLPDYFGYPLVHDRYRPYWKFAQAEGLLVLSHTWGGSGQNGPDQAGQLLRAYPGLTLVAGHSFHGDWDRAGRMAAEYPDLYLDLCAVADDRGAVELLVERAGSRKILFGTDLPWFDLHYYIGAVLSADLTDEARRDIFYRNGVRLLGRFSWFGQIWEERERDAAPARRDTAGPACSGVPRQAF